ncbi:LacI family DNA-binding transcriptional regulator [Streptomyces sp. NPDC058272]|uniref:LacI family DNA-binding transcriptional regulator n=1 Tax=Streptomyces sp. NPDC058272 TaxID=3346415 RepID=UPI0036E12149
MAVDHEARAASIFHVLVDNVCGAHQATEHLLRHGRRRIGCTAGQLGLRTTTDRVTGWRTALEAAGLRAGSGSGGRTGWRPAAAPLLHGSYGRLEGHRAALALLAHHRLVDALFVTSDEQAAGVLRAAHELGIRISGDLAVVSLDGTTGSASTLSTMRRLVEQLARTAMVRLTGLMRDPDLPPGRDVLPAELLARGSCGCPDPEGAPPSPSEVPAAVEDSQMACEQAPLTASTTTVPPHDPGHTPPPVLRFHPPPARPVEAQAAAGRRCGPRGGRPISGKGWGMTPHAINEATKRMAQRADLDVKDTATSRGWRAGVPADLGRLGYTADDTKHITG